MLEASCYADNSFLTLTYEKDPVSLVPLDHRRFMDALRKRLSPLRIRFYMVGEYGEKNHRPHFHYALFGYPSCRADRRSSKFRCCAACDLLEEVWGRGLIKNLPLEAGSARYIARYVVKKMTRFDDPRLGNLHPEFARMSLKPGIGTGVLDDVARLITQFNLLTPQGDVPVTLRHGDLEWPLGRYLRRQLRKKLGLNEKAPQFLSPEAAYAAFKESPMRALQEAARADQETGSLKLAVLRSSLGKRLQIHRRQKMFFNSKGKLDET